MEFDDCPSINIGGILASKQRTGPQFTIRGGYRGNVITRAAGAGGPGTSVWV